MKSFFGYPGGKSRLAKRLIPFLNDAQYYAEPFAGGFSVGLSLLDSDNPPKNIWLNDFDRDIVCLWKAVLSKTEELCDLIQSVKVTSETFYELREVILRGDRRSIIKTALDKLVVHKLSFSNLGEMSGSTVGGREQTGDWKFDVRWHPTNICRTIRRVVSKFKGVELKITNTNIFELIDQIPKKFVVYLDPPYVDGGPKCYKHAFDEISHRDLAQKLKKAPWRWVMSYDNHPLIRELYRGQFHEIEHTYPMSSTNRAGQKHKEATELVIRSK